MISITFISRFFFYCADYSFGKMKMVKYLPKLVGTKEEETRTKCDQN